MQGKAIARLLSGLAILLPCLPRPASAAPPIPRLSRSEAEWGEDFARLKRTDPEFRVSSVDEFKRITEFYAGMATDGMAEHSFVTRAGESFRCVYVATQRSFRDSARPGSLPLLAPLEPPAGEGSRQVRSDTTPTFGLDGSIDEEGDLRSCPAMTFAQLVPRLHDLYRFASLESIFAKHPDRAASGETASGIHSASADLFPPASAPTGHEYGHAYEYVNNIGTTAAFNLWSPAVQRNDEFSLSQMWLARGQYDDNTLQTVEAGWQVFPELYGDAKAHLFIYSTSAAYTANSGCYNLMCSRFVQTDSSVPIGGAFSNYSSPGGTQYEASLTVFRDPASNDWWVRYGDTWVGYYPSSLFHSTGILNFAEKVDCGGEIVNDDVNGVHTTTAMGSGRFPSDGDGRAAYIRAITYWTPANVAFYPSGLTPDATNPTDYGVSVHYNDPNWHTYLFFGGPGGGATSALLPNLAPYVPQGWSAAAVISNDAGDTIGETTAASTDSLFLNWAIQNNGTATTGAPFDVDLYLDGKLMTDWSAHVTTPLKAGYYLDETDIAIGKLSIGTHSIVLMADPSHAVAEWNESDNRFTLAISVAGAPCNPSVNPRCGVRIIVPKPEPPRH